MYCKELSVDAVLYDTVRIASMYTKCLVMKVHCTCVCVCVPKSIYYYNRVSDKIVAFVFAVCLLMLLLIVVVQ